MSQTPTDRAALGRQLLSAQPYLSEVLESFHGWLPVAVERCPDNKVVPVFKDGSLVQVQHPFGAFEVIEELGRFGNELVWRIVFCKPANALRDTPLPFYIVRLHRESAFFGDDEGAVQFEYDSNTDYWKWRNILKLGYELAIAATEPSACSTIPC